MLAAPPPAMALVAVAQINMHNKAMGEPAQAYNTTMYIMAGLLVVGLIANSLIKPVDPKHHLAEES